MVKAKTTNINFFGIRSNSVKKQNTKSFLPKPGFFKMNIPKPTQFKGTVNYGFGVSKQNKAKPISNLKVNNSYWYNSPSLNFRKESIRSKKLSKYGDADLDGSPNAFDCNPWKVNKDAQEIPEGAFSVKNEGKTQYTSKPKDTKTKSEKREERRKSRIEKAESITKELVSEMAKTKHGGLSAETLSARAIERGKVPKERVLKKLAAIERRKISGKDLRGKITALAAREEDIKAKVAKTKKAFMKEYTGAQIAKSRRIKRVVKTGLSTVFGSDAVKSVGSFQQGRGRPKGPSGRYTLNDRPVYEEEYQQYSMKQKAMNRISPSVQQTSPIQKEQIYQMQAQQIVTQSESLQEQPQGQEDITPEQLEQIKSEQGYTKTSASELRAAQELAQQNDNVLHAPNFSKGELKGTGGSLLTAKGPQILDAPNVLKGHMRTMSASGNKDEIVVGERPSTNPYGDEFIDIDLSTGKPVLKRRPREKWATGEAL